MDIICYRLGWVPGIGQAIEEWALSCVGHELYLPAWPSCTSYSPGDLVQRYQDLNLGYLGHLLNLTMVLSVVLAIESSCVTTVYTAKWEDMDGSLIFFQIK